MNSQDPLHDVEDYQRLLFERFSTAATGFSANAVIGASINLLINAVRQSAGDWRAAEAMFDDYLGKSKQLLKNHYDTHGRKRGIFPYDQTVHVDHFIDPDGFKRT